MKHPACTIPFEKLVEGLDAEVRSGNLMKKERNGLFLYNYLPVCQFSKSWNIFTLSARGIILSQDRVAALPFPKFFNYGEQSLNLPDESFTVSEKMDGSLGIIYFYGGRWNVATRGSFDSDQAVWAEQQLADRCDVSALDPGVTYLCEIVYRGNRIVISYDYEGLVLLSAYCLESGEELSIEELDSTAASAGFRRPESYTYRLDQMLDLVKTLPAQSEGFVVRFESGFRVKIKGAEYCRLHRIISDITPLALWESMMNADNMDAIKAEIPEEYYDDFDMIRGIIQSLVDDLLARIRTLHEETLSLSDRDLGKLLQSGSLNPDVSRFLFAARKDDLFVCANQKGALREKLFRSIRPAGNLLAGYTPSTAFMRFGREK